MTASALVRVATAASASLPTAPSAFASFPTAPCNSNAKQCEPSIRFSFHSDARKCKPGMSNSCLGEKVCRRNCAYDHWEDGHLYRSSLPSIRFFLFPPFLPPIPFCFSSAMIIALGLGKSTFGCSTRAILARTVSGFSPGSRFLPCHIWRADIRSAAIRAK